MRRKSLLLGLVAAFTVAGIAQALAGPVIPIVIAVAGAIIEGGSIITALALGALSVGLSLLGQALNPTPKQQTADQQFNLKGMLQSGGTVARSFLIGEYMTAGSEFYPARTWGQSGKTQNAYFTRFIALSDLPMTALTGIIVDGKVCTYGSGSPDANLGYAIPEYNNGSDHLWVKFHDGTQTTADSWAHSQFGSDPDYPYGTDQIGYGVAYVIVTALIDQTLFPSFPDFKFIGQGYKFYDPRADGSTGGSGSQRFDDQSTWAYSKNPAVIKYNILRGITFGGQWVYGLQNTAAGRLPFDNWVAAMNVCDADVEYQSGVSRPQFQCSGEIDITSQPADLIDELNKADNGKVAEIGGIFKTRSGPVGSAVLSFTDKDLIVTEGKSFDPFPGLEDTINGVDATFPDPSQLWTMTGAPSLYNSDLETADGGRRLISSIQYNFVPDPDQVQFLMKSALGEARKFRKHTVVAPPWCFPLEPLDIVAWSSDENGYDAKLFTVVPTDQANCDQGLVLTEVDPADYDWDPETDYRTYTPVTIVGQPVPSQAMTGFAVAGVSMEGADGRAVAAIELEWGTDGIYAVNGVQYEIRLKSDSSLAVAGETDAFATGHAYVSQNINGKTDYQARLRYRPVNPAQGSDWSDWLDVTTPDVKIVGDQLEDAILTYAKFASTIKPVQVSDDGVGGSFADVVAEEGATAVDANTGKLYTYHDGAWTASASGAESFSDLTGEILADQFSTTIRPVEVFATKPTTGNFDGRMIFLTTDKKIYRYDATADDWTAEVDGADLKANSIEAGAIAAGAIGTDQLSANAITASKLLIGDTSNLVLDYDCVDPDAWENGTADGRPDPDLTFVSLASPWPVAHGFEFTSSSSSEVDIFSQGIACKAGDQFYLSVLMACASGSGPNHVKLWGGFYSGEIGTSRSGKGVGGFDIGNTASGTPVEVSGTVTAPSGATRLYLVCYIDVDAGTHTTGIVGRPIVRRLADSVTIADGAITAAKLTTDSVTAGAIAAGAINASEIIVDNIVVTGHLVDNTVTDESHATLSGSYDTTSSLASIGVSVSVNLPSGNAFCLVQIVGGTLVKNTGNPSANLTFGVYRDGSTGVAGINNVPNSGAASQMVPDSPGSGTHTYYIMANDNVGGGGWTFSGSWKLSVVLFQK